MSPRLSFSEGGRPHQEQNAIDNGDINNNNGNGNATSNANYLQVATPKSPNSDVFEEDSAHIPDHHQQNVLLAAEKKLKQDLLDQIDVEILLKHKEHNLVMNELEKVKNNLSILKNLHGDSNYSKFVNQLLELQQLELPPPSQQHHSSYSSYGSVPSSSYGGSQTQGSNGGVDFGPYSLRKSSLRPADEPTRIHRTSYGGIHPIVDANGNKICVHKRSDGVIVKVECGACGRTDFGSAQGFLNHSRLSHQIEFKSQDHAALECGQVLSEIEQDEQGTQSLIKLREAGLDVNKNLAPGFKLEENENGKKKRKLSKSGKTPPSFKNQNHNQSNSQGQNSNTTSASATESPAPPSTQTQQQPQSSVNPLSQVPGKTLPSAAHLAKLYATASKASPNSNTSSEFQSLLEEVTIKSDLALLEDEEDSPPPSETTLSNTLSNSNPPSSNGAQPAKPSLVKGHNRRKSRGGLSSVKFEDDFLTSSFPHSQAAPSSTGFSNSNYQSHTRSDSAGSTIDQMVPSDEDTLRFNSQFTNQGQSQPTITINPSDLLQQLQQDDETNGNDDEDYEISDVDAMGNPHLMMHLMTPAQKRRIPTVPNPLRTRARANKEGSH